ncbi:MAG: FG-GAP-like repeat-containing protein [Pyrinomonadaceae bacterium]
MIKINVRSSTILLTILLTAAGIQAQLDPTFGTNGRTLRTDPGFQVPKKSFLLPDGKILVLAWQRMGSNNFDPITFIFARFNSDGTVDTSYGTNGTVTLAIPFLGTPQQYDLADALRQPDGKIVAVGWDNGNGLIVRVNENGTLDTSFSGDGIHRPNINQQGGDALYRVVLEPDGKITAVGATSVINVPSAFLIRYQPDGELDFGFGDQGGFIVRPMSSEQGISGLGRQSDGRYIVLAAGFDAFPGPLPAGRAYRFNSNGSADNSFTSPTFGYLDATRLLVLSNDKVLIGGNPSLTDMVLRTTFDIKLTRLNADGGIDSSFGNGGNVVVSLGPGTDDQVADLIELPGGGIALAATSVVPKNRSSISGGQITVFTFDSGGTLAGRYPALEGAASNILRQADGKLILAASYATLFTPDVLVARLTSVPLTTPRFHAIPFEFTNSTYPQGISQPAVFRPSNTKWYAAPILTNGVSFGLSTDILVAGDYYGNMQTELAVFRPSNGTWYIAKTYSSTDFITIRWGLSGDIPAAYDYDGDGKHDPTVFRPSDGNWYIHQSSDGGARFVHWGASGDKPVTGDYDGDGLGDTAIWRPSTGVWYINRSSDGQAAIVGFGSAGDIPVQEDYDGDLKTDIAVFRPSTGVWYIWRSSDGGFTIVPFGASGDVPVPGDYDGDRKMDISVYRPSTSVWYRINSSGGTEQFVWGVPGDVAVQGRY